MNNANASKILFFVARDMEGLAICDVVPFVEFVAVVSEICPASNGSSGDNNDIANDDMASNQSSSLWIEMIDRWMFAGTYLIGT